MNMFQLFIYPATLSFLYAASDEFHQSFVPTRSASFKDVLIDTIGIVVFYIVIVTLNFVIKQKNNPPMKIIDRG